MNRTASGYPRSSSSALRGRSSARCASSPASTPSSRRAPGTTAAPSRTLPRGAGCAHGSTCRPAHSPLAAGEPVRIETPGSTMAGLDCAEVSTAAWPILRNGIHGTISVSKDEAKAAVAELELLDLAIGHSGAAALAALRVLMSTDGDD